MINPRIIPLERLTKCGRAFFNEGNKCSGARVGRGDRDLRPTRPPLQRQKRKMPDVDVKSNPAFSSRCAAKTELCVTVFSLWALVSFDSKVFTAYPHRIRQLPDPRELAVDLFNRASK